MLVCNSGNNCQPLGPTDGHQGAPLPSFIRFYIYAIQGFCDEIVFTAVLDFLWTGDWSLKGHSSIYSFFIYGTCSFLLEHLYVFLHYRHGVRRRWRLPLYMCIAYSWEFTTGSVLRWFGACPWDYSHYRLHYKGLITPYYAPGWIFLGFLQDLLADYLLHLRVLPTGGIVFVKNADVLASFSNNNNMRGKSMKDRENGHGSDPGKME